MDEVTMLRTKLKVALMDSLNSGGWGVNTHLMTKQLTRNEKAFGQLSSGFNENFTETALSSLRDAGSLDTYREWKHACFGVSLAIDKDSWRLLEDTTCFSKLLTYVDGIQSNPRRFLKCYFGLLAGYFTYPVLSEDTPPAGIQNWKQLREYLNARLPFALAHQHTGHKLLQTLNEHHNLLQSYPCDRYAANLLQGDTQELDQVLRTLCVPTESWVREAAMLVRFKKACEMNDPDFLKYLEPLLGIIQGVSGFSLSVRLARRCTALLICRYSDCASRPEHAALRDTAVKQIGNPWLRRAAWDAYVKTSEGKPHEEARQMVNGWLKRRLIRDFFELLSDDGSADTRRLSYWLRFEPAIEDMWFALGPYAQFHRGKEFVDFRTRADGRRLALEGGTSPENNAFIMRLGEWVIVEFGANSNACYVYRWSQLPFDLNRTIIRSDKSGLKNAWHERRGIHRDSSGFTWENKFDEWLCPMLNFYPHRQKYQDSEQSSSWKSNQQTVSSSYPERSFASSDESIFSPTFNRSQHERLQKIDWDELKSLAILHSLKIEDQRAKGGALWIRIDDSQSNISNPLKQWGFKYKSGKGWWKQ